MTDERNRKALAVTPQTTHYEVGYGKPPQGSRYKPGQSGNPKGRPKGSRNKASPPLLYEERLKTIILEEAYRSVSVNDVRGPTTLPMAQAVIRSIAVNAVKGGQRAQRLFTELLSTVERENRRLHDEWLDTAMEYKIQWERELERRTRLGITGPEPLPHPDHVVIDIRNGTAHIRGPATKEEKAEWDRWLDRRAMFEEERDELMAMLDAPDCPHREIVTEELKQTEKVLEIIGRALFDERKNL